MNGYCGSRGYLVIFLVFSKGYIQRIAMIAQEKNKHKGEKNFDSAFSITRIPLATLHVCTVNQFCICKLILNMLNE